MNSKGHLYCSIVKSILRIGGCVASVLILATDNLELSISVLAGTLAFAECLGIFEELLDRR